MPEFTKDWFSSNIPTWTHILLPHFAGKPVSAIELGAFEGKASLWLLDNVLTHPHSTLTCVDNWEGDTLYTQEEVDWKGAKRRFTENIKPYPDKVSVWNGESADYLKHREDSVDLIYIDAGHAAHSVLTDAILSDLILNQNGILIFDDYLWTGLEKHPFTPKPAIDAFMDCFSGSYKLLSLGYQVILLKK